MSSATNYHKKSDDCITVCLVTLGCAKNEVDSSLMEERLLESGYFVIDDPRTADAIIVNTCCFIQEATEESLDTIFSLYDAIEEEARTCPIIVAGCMPARYKDALSDELSEAASFVPCHEEHRIVDVLESVLPSSSAAATGSSQKQICGSNHPLSNYGVSRYVKISDGCDRFCSYCAIPFIRGPYRSFSLDSIALRVASEIESGAKEIVFIAQDTGRWGEDFDQPSCLADLLEYFASQYRDIWFRVLYTEPEGVSNRLIDVIASHDNICSYFDIPLQHVNPQILSAMNRSGSAEEFHNLFNRIRSSIPKATLRTTFIAGFPGETEEVFAELLDFIENEDLDYIGVFPFSPEEGTRAAQLDNQVDIDTRISRAQEIRDLADNLSCARIADRIGMIDDLIIEGAEDDGQLFGRLGCQAPEIDGVTYIDSGAIGDKVRVNIIDTLFYEMEGCIVGDDG